MTTVFALSAQTLPPIDVRTLGAKGDRITDDSGAFQAAFQQAISSGGCVQIPPGMYQLSSAIAVNVPIATDDRAKGLCVNGAGPTSVLIANNATGGISISGSIGHAFEFVYLSNFKIQSAPSLPTGFGIQLVGVAGFGLQNIHIDGSNGAMAYGMRLIATQQGYIKGGVNFRARVGISLERTSEIGSNGVEISGVSFDNVDEGLRVAAVDDGSFHSNHLTFSRYGVHVTGGGSGSYTLDSNHFGGHSGASIFQEGGSTVIRNSSFYSPVELNITGGGSVVDGNLLNGNVTFGAAVESSTFSNNWTFGAVANASPTLLHVNNRPITGAPLVTPSRFPDAASFNSRGAAGDILTLNPNGGVAGDWGLTINAPASGRAYVRLGNTAISAAGDGSLRLGALSVDAGGGLALPAAPRFNGPSAAACPAANCVTPYTWIQVTAADGTQVWIPGFR